MEKSQKLYEIMFSKYDSEADLEVALAEFIKTDLLWPSNKVSCQFPVQVGHESKRGDIMFGDNIVVEVKKQGLDILRKEFIRQLMSYMRIKLKRFGILIGSELIFFYDVYSDGVEDLRYVLRLTPEDLKRPISQEFLDLISAPNFSEARLVDFCEKYYHDNGEKKALTLVSGYRKSSDGRMKKSTNIKNNAFWLDFRKCYANKDNLIPEMELGKAAGLWIGRGAIKNLLEREYGIQFGISNGNRANTRKVEICKIPEEAFQKYFEPHLQEIKEGIIMMGGDYSTKSPRTVINCFFPISGDDEKDNEIIFEKYQQFKALIMKYYQDTVLLDITEIK